MVKVNYVLRAIRVPAGQHNIEFHFMPASFYGARKVAVVGSDLIMLLNAASVYTGVKQKGGSVALKA